MRTLAIWVILVIIGPMMLLVSLFGIYTYGDGVIDYCEEAAGIEGGDWDGLTTSGLHDEPGVLCEFDLENGTTLVVHATAWSGWVVHLFVIVGSIAFAWLALRPLPFYVLVSFGGAVYGSLGLLFVPHGLMRATWQFTVALAAAAVLSRWLIERRKRLPVLNP